MKSELDRLCERDGVTAVFRFGEAKSEGFPSAAHNWRVTLKRKGKQLSVDFFGGAAVTNPTAADVLSSLLLDACTWENDELHDLGYTDTREFMRVYKALEQQVPKTKRFMGNALDEYTQAGH